MRHHPLNIEFWLVRHGESENNVRFDPPYLGANTWSELTEKGKADAVALGKSWADQGVRVDAWLSSPTVRTQQTCRFCQDGMGRPWPQVELLMELIELRQGSAEGQPRGDYRQAVSVSGHQAPKFLSPGDSDDQFWLSKLHPLGCITSVPGAESQAEVFQRTRRCLEEFAEHSQYDSQTVGRSEIYRVAIFTHENVIKCLLLGLGLWTEPYRSLSLPNISVTRVYLRSNHGWRWSLIRE